LPGIVTEEIMKFKTFIVLLIILFLIPALTVAAGKKHPTVSTEQSCSECHESESTVWQDNKHGLMGVGCVVCHGDLDKNFMKKPGPERCTGCHAEQAAGKTEGHKQKPKSCWTCHNGHTLKTKQGR